MSGRELAERLARHGFDFFTGVPCSLVEDLIAVLERQAHGPYAPAAREDAAVGLAGGAWFAGKRPAVLMQNSGLGTSLNALASFALMYGVPMLLLVTWRGFAGKDAPEHILMGEISPRLLELLGIPWSPVSRESVDAHLAWAAREMDARLGPVALLLPQGVVEMGGVAAGEPWGAPSPRPAGTLGGGDPGRPAISRRAALAVAVKQLGHEPVVHANGYICRESFSVADRPQNFYMLGSMGLAPAIALGVALARPARAAVAFDGDGNLVMNLGVLPMVGSLAPRNFVHCVFDNEVYGSTGGQRSLSRDVRLDRLAGAAGYRTVAAVTEADDLAAALRAALASDGPHFILVKVTDEEADVPRIPHTPAAIRDRFRKSVLGG